MGKTSKKQKKIIENNDLSTINLAEGSVSNVQKNVEEKVDDKKIKVIEKDIDKYLLKLKKKIIKETKVQNKNIGKPTQMVIDEKKNRTNVTVFDNNFNIEYRNNEYSVSVDETQLHVIVNKPNVKVICGAQFVYVEKHDYLYCVVTNQKVNLSDNIFNFSDDLNVSSFTIDNLSLIEFEENCMSLKNDDEEITDNDTLFISQEEGKVYLPYKVEDLKEEIQKYNNVSLTQLIQMKYIQPIDKYKFAIKARYNEAFNLMREKEGKSVVSAIMLGLELMFEFNLHPAVISACKNLEELDIYLDCLDDNELEKFSCFKIAYKALPTLSKLKKFQSQNQ